ncbi:MAG: hypothetical protein IIZ78_10830 [Clostridiales bacterium]|nr:hypothetical protein [Clostridiales bacterium]
MVVKCADFQPERYFANPPLLKNRRGNPGGKKRHYIGITTAFDIETTLLDDIQQSVMYIWQWQFGEDYTVIGRTWDEFLDLQKRIKAALPADRWLVVYVHNLSYEFQFLKGIYQFFPDDVFAVASRKVVKADMWGCLEFRCSYKLTNMSLKQFTSKMRVEHQKLSGDEFNYSVKRYPWTPLSDEELEYCTNDVLGLVEAVNALMERDEDTLQTIPLTSTGYVRRNAKRAMKDGSVHHNFVYSILPDIETYRALREAFRGGNTHANRYYAGDIVENVHSADRSSSYPAVMCNCEFPMSEFIPILKKDLNSDYISRCIKIRHKALLLRIGIKNLRLRDRFWGCPYLSKDKCRNIHKAVDTEDNGRILEAEYLETTITDIDLKIIMEEYQGEIIFLQGWYASYKKLPQPLINEVIKYYKDKTELKGVKGQEIYYDKAKALLNSLYGMMAQDPVKHNLIFQQVGDWEEDTSLSDEEILGKSNKRAFLAYQWGVWVTAHSRDALERGIRLVQETDGADFVYCDTDSVKYTGNVDWSGYNSDRIYECRESGSMAVDPSGVTHYMGVFETEDLKDTGFAYRYFKTLGAKKYAYIEREGEGVHCTIAGVNKKKGGKELDKFGGLSAFAEGFIFREAGGTQAVYNDSPEMDHVDIEGRSLPITANVAILPSEYTLGITGEYERIIKYSKKYLYNPYVI